MTKALWTITMRIALVCLAFLLPVCLLAEERAASTTAAASPLRPAATG